MPGTFRARRRRLAWLLLPCLVSACAVAGEPPPAAEPNAVTVANVDASVTADALRGLPFDAFLEASFEALVRRSPERVTTLEMADELGMRNDRLDDLSAGAVRETQALQRSVLEILRTYDRGALSVEDRLSYDVYAWSLDDAVRGQPFAEHDYPITHCRVGHHYGLLRLLTELHPLRSAADAEDYVSRIEQVDGQVRALLDGMERRRAAGVVPPRFVIEKSQDVLSSYVGTRSRHASEVDVTRLSLYTRFEDALAGIPDLTGQERTALLQRARTAIETAFVPAYLDQLGYLDRLADEANDDAGVWKLPDGRAYYDYLLQSYTTTDRTAEEIHAAGRREVARVEAEMRAAFAELGYPPDRPLAELVARAVEEAGSLPMGTPAERDAVIRAWETLVAEAEARVAPAFVRRPEAPLEVVGGLGGEYYVPGSADGDRPCEFHVGQSAQSQPRYLMRTVVSHEAVPGHHYQIALAGELGLPRFRADIRLPAYTEGWALYAEGLAWERGFYADDPYGDIGRLLCQLLRAARLVVDTGIHAQQWTREEARAYMNETVGARPGTFDDEIDRTIVAPALATANEVGAMEIRALRARAREALGDDFSLGEFHDAVIGHGSLPIGLLRAVVDDYIAAAATDG